MQKEEYRSAVSKKAYAICYAAFRIAASMRNRVFEEHLEAWALSLLESANTNDVEKAEAALINLEYLASLARDTDFLSIANCDIFLSEIKAIRLALRDATEHKLSDIDLGEVFKESGASFRDNAASPSSGAAFTEHSDSMSGQDNVKDKIDSRSLVGLREGNAPISFNQENITANYPARNSAKIEERQSAIIEKIRQSGVCRLKDFQDIFPDASERTLRYDVQNLIERGVIERIGNGGPQTAYRVRNTAPEGLPAPSFSLQ